MEGVRIKNGKRVGALDLGGILFLQKSLIKYLREPITIYNHGLSICSSCAHLHWIADTYCSLQYLREILLTSFYPSEIN
jgi:hypothetical protein